MEENNSEKLIVYAVIYGQGPNWECMAAERQLRIDEHISYQRGWLDRGALMAGGPFLDSAGGMAIFRADSADEIELIIDKDPAVVAGVYKAELQRWHVRRSMLGL